MLKDIAYINIAIILKQMNKFYIILVLLVTLEIIGPQKLLLLLNYFCNCPNIVANISLSMRKTSFFGNRSSHRDKEAPTCTSSGKRRIKSD